MKRLRKRRRWLAALAAGTLLAAGCDAATQDEILNSVSTAVSSVADTLIRALFDSLRTANDSDNTHTTVRANGQDLIEIAACSTLGNGAERAVHTGAAV